MSNKHTIVLRELAKFFSGLIFADILFGLCVGGGLGYGSLFLGIPLVEPLINIWIILDVVLFLLLVHYAWRITRPPSPAHRIFYITVGCLLSIVALAHFFRIIFSVPLVIGNLAIPSWISVVGALITGFLAYASFHFAQRK